MREIKFRAYISPSIIITFTLQDLSNDALFNIRVLVKPWLLEGHKPDECIGLKDKNGREMYEGDVILVPSGERCQIAWDNRAFFYPKWIGHDDVTTFFTFISYPADKCEVIGNIHEKWKTRNRW